MEEWGLMCGIARSGYLGHRSCISQVVSMLALGLIVFWMRFCALKPWIFKNNSLLWCLLADKPLGIDLGASEWS